MFRASGLWGRMWPRFGMPPAQVTHPEFDYDSLYGFSGIYYLARSAWEQGWHWQKLKPESWNRWFEGSRAFGL